MVQLCVNDSGAMFRTLDEAIAALSLVYPLEDAERLQIKENISSAGYWESEKDFSVSVVLAEY